MKLQITDFQSSGRHLVSNSFPFEKKITFSYLTVDISISEIKGSMLFILNIKPNH